MNHRIALTAAAVAASMVLPAQARAQSGGPGFLFEQPRVRLQLHTGYSVARMSDAGVPSDVIDVMVAVTYPQRFHLGGPPNVRTTEATPQRVAQAYAPRSRFRGCDPFFWDPFCYGYGYGYYGSNYGYGLYGGYPFYGGYGGWGYGGYTPIVIQVQPNDNPPEHGRVVRGRGYVPANSSGGSTRSGHPSGSAAPSSGNRGASASPSAGRSSGSSSGRTAHRRGGGGRR